MLFPCVGVDYPYTGKVALDTTGMFYSPQTHKNLNLVSSRYVRLVLGFEVVFFEQIKPKKQSPHITLMCGYS